MKKTVLAALCAGALAACGAAPERPYEFEWANRAHDEFPPADRMEGVDGWKASGTNAEAVLSDGTEFALFGKGTLRVSYRVTGESPSFRLAPPRPLACPDGFDTLSVWIRAMNRRQLQFKFAAEFEDAGGGRFDMQLGDVRHDEWQCEVGVMPPELRSRAAKGAKFLGFRFEGCTNAAFQVMDLTSLCLYRDPRRPVAVTERAKRGVQIFKDQPQGHNTGPGSLPFPNRPDTILPPRREIKGLEFRLPGENAVAWDELAFRVDGGEWIPLAVGGGLYPRDAAKGAKVRFRREANSVVAEVEAAAGVTDVKFGAGRFPAGTSLVGWPYFTLGWCYKYDLPGYEKGGIYRPKTAVFQAGGRTLCAGAMFDWTQSGASAPSDREEAGEGLGQLCCGLMYVPKTDGARNRVYERLVWTVGDGPADVFPVVPNPDSPWKHVAGAGVWRAHPASADRRDDYRFWRSVRDAGIRHMIVTDHETGWRDGSESFTFRTRPAPKKGGDKGQYDYARFMIDELGFRYGPYNNFTDYAPVNGNWSVDRVGRRCNGSLIPAWHRCYSPKSTWAVGMCERLAPEIQSKFGFSTAYCDVHTIVMPWGRCDYDARMPGAGTFAQVFYDYGEIMLLQKKAWNGPVYSEGGFHWWYSGLTDGNYAQDQTYGLASNPWLVDFDLVRMHDKCCNFGMGNPNMFYGWTRHEDDRYVPAGREEYLMRFLAATIAFGHPGFLVCNPKSGDLDDAKASYFLVQGIAAKYTQASAVEIRYADEAGRLWPAAEAIANGAYRLSRVFVRYSDGTEVAVNGSRSGDFGATVLGRAYTLPPNGWVAISGDRRAGSMNTMMNLERCQIGWSDEYQFWRRDGKVSVLKTDLDGLRVFARGDPASPRRVGETTEFVVVANSNVTARIWADNCGRTVALPRTAISLRAGEQCVFATKLDDPGFLRFHAEAAEGGLSATATVPYEPERIVPAKRRPEDFDAYWDGELARLEREVPLDPRMEPMPRPAADGLREFALSFATFNGKRVYGFVAIPEKASAANRMRLRITVPGAGPGACSTWDAAPDEIVATLNALPFKPGRDAAEQSAIYADYNKGIMARYGVQSYARAGWWLGRDNVFFHDAIVGIVRAVKWLRELPEVDPNRLTYFGGSQGGGMGMATVALSGCFSKAFFYITAMSDLCGGDAWRSDGWPSRASCWPKGISEAGLQTLLATAPYYDACNFAARITCPALVSLGLEDCTCPPPNVQASFNCLASKDKKMVFDADTHHGIRGETLIAVYEWLKR